MLMNFEKTISVIEEIKPQKIEEIEPDSPLHEEIPEKDMTDTRKQLKEDFHIWKTQTLYFEDFFVSQMKLDIRNFSLTFVLELNEDVFEFVTINFPKEEEYPVGMYEIIIDEDEQFTIKLEGDDLVSVLENIFDEFNRKKEMLKENIVIQDNEEEIIIEEEYDTTIEKWATDILNTLKKEVALINKTPGWNASVELLSEDILLKLSINPRNRIKLTTLSGIARGLDMDKFIVISLTIPMKAKPPQIQFFQTTELEKKYEKSESKFGICSFLDVFLKNDKFLDKNLASTKLKTPKFAHYLLKYVEDFCINCTQQCIICGEKLPIEGIRPTICQKTLCVFGHENLGLGIDVAYEIQNHSDIVDLLITITYAAAQPIYGDFDPFKPFPEGVSANTTEGSLSFLKNKTKDRELVAEVISLIPNVKTLQKWTNEGKLIENLYKCHPLAFPLIQWLLGSNRTHLKKLNKKESIKEMNTTHQYYLLSATPEKEEKFQKYKKQYGSLWAFHGSGLANWHAIFRNGLKNMSGTSGQLNGAAYGKGIYLAAESATSFGYSRTGNVWCNSQIEDDDVLCIALCEIIKHPCTWLMPNPYYVISNEDLVMTRYFFFFPGGTSESVIAKSIKPPQIEK
eukprot:gene8754-702_t